jgi:hypothetical protein
MPVVKMPKWKLVVVAVLVVSAVGLLLWSSVRAGDVAEVVGMMGEKELRDPLRPARGAPRVLVIGVDGLGHGSLFELLDAGQLPNLSRLFGADRGEGLYDFAYAVPNAMSILPSTTMAAWTSIFTGQPPARSGVPGNEWFVREQMRFFAPGPTSVEEHQHTLRVFTEGLLGNQISVPTLFELADVRSYASLSLVHRGADVLSIPDITVLGDLMGTLARGVGEGEQVDRAPYEELDRSSIASLEETLDAHGIPDLQVVYLPGTDLFTHVAEDPIENKRRYLIEVLDPAIGRLLEHYERAGVLQETYVVIVSDHGHTPVLNDDRHALRTDERRDPPALLELLGFRLRPFTLTDDASADYQATVAYQGAMAYVYLADRSTCPREGDPCAWILPPRLGEDVLPVARAFYEANETGAWVPELQGTLDLVFAREPRRIGEDAAPFQVFDGTRLVPIGEYLAANPRPDLLRFEERMNDLAVGPFGHRAGDVLLMARSGMHRPIEDRYYFSAEYRSWHGSAHPDDSHIPLVVARPGGSGQEIRARVSAAIGERPSQLDVVPLVLELLGRTGSPAAADTAAVAAG